MTTHIYDNPADRWLVELRVSYPEDFGISSAAHAAAAALDLILDRGWAGTMWVVTDRTTGAVHQLEQETFVHLSDEWKDR